MARRKDLTQTHDAGAAGQVLWSLSKSALADLVVDLVRRCEQDAELDGPQLAAKVREAFEPVARVRGDRVPGQPRRYRVPCEEGGRRYGWTIGALPAAVERAGGEFYDESEVTP